MAYLLAKDPSGVEKRFELPSNQVIILGRSQERCTIVLPGKAVSSIHATMQRVNGEWIFKDLSSTNGSRINGKEAVPETEIHVYRNDVIAFADYSVTLEGGDVLPRRAEGLPDAAPAGIKPIAIPGRHEGNTVIIPPVKKPAAAPAPAPVPLSDGQGPKIAPLAAGAGGAAHMPGSFQKKKSGGKLWIAAIILVGIIAAALIFLLAR